MRTVWSALVALAMVVGVPAAGAAAAGRSSPPATPDRRASAPTGGLPLVFEENAGQHHADARFLARPRGFHAWFADGEVVLDAPTGDAGRDVLRMRFGAASEGAGAAPRGGPMLPGRSNYFVGNDPSMWVTDAPHRAGVVYPDVVPGVDLAWRSGPRSELEYVVTAAAGADAERFEFILDGAVGLDLSAGGDLVVTTPRGEVRHGRPTAFQETDTGLRRVACSFDVRGDRRVGFRVGSHDPARALVIDPTVGWATYYGGTGGESRVEVASDSAGAAYVAGKTGSANFPCVGAAQGSLAGGSDAFVVKIPAAGTSVAYATYIGGSAEDDSRGVAVDSSGAAYVSGYTDSTNFPTLSAFQSSNGGGYNDGFVFKLNSAGSSLVYSTYLGGANADRAFNVAVDATGAAYVTGTTHSPNFPTAGAFQSSYGGGADGAIGQGDAFVTKLSPAGTTLTWSTYLGGSGPDAAGGIALDASGAVLVAGGTGSSDFPITSGAYLTTYPGYTGAATAGFVAKITGTGTRSWATYLGAGTLLNAVVAGATGDVHVAGETNSASFPTTSGALQTARASDGGSADSCVVKLSADGSTLRWATLYGGNGYDSAKGMALGADGSLWFGGTTRSTDLVLQSPIQGALNGLDDAFVARVSSSGATLVFGTYIGGGLRANGTTAYEELQGLVVAPGGVVYAVGHTVAADFPTVSAVQASFGGGNELDAFIVRIDPPIPTAPTSLSATSVTDRVVALAWTDTTIDEANFEVERSPAGGAFARIATPAAEATTYTDATVSGESAYDYRVRATNVSGASPWSNVLRVTTGPIAPTGLSAAAQSNTRVALAWSDRSGTETSFRIERRADSAPTWALAGTVGANAVTFTDTSAPPETLLHYRVRASNANAPSEWAPAASVMTTPANPTARTPTNAAGGSVAVAWNDVSLSEKGFELQRASGWPGTSWTTIALLPPNSTTYSDTAVEPESVYSYRVRSFNDLGTSDWVDLGHLTTGPYGPTDLAAEPLSPTRAAVSWTDRSRMEIGYEVLRSEDGIFVPVADLSANATGLAEGSLSQETQYTYRVRTFNQHGKSAWSEVTVKTPSALVVRSAKIVRGKGKKPKPSVLTATGEFDVGGTGIDLAGDATLVVGDTAFDLSGLALKKGVYRFTSDAITLDLTPSMRGQSRVTFQLTLRGAPVDALAPDGETLFAYRNGPFDASGLVTLAADRYAIGRNRLVDPALVVSSFAGTLRGKGRDSLKVTGYFDASRGLEVPVPDVVVRLDGFEFRANGTEFRTAGTKATFSIRASAGGATISRKVVLDWAKGTVQVTLTGADLGEFEPGAVPVAFALEVGDAKCGDTYVAACNGKSLKY